MIFRLAHPIALLLFLLPILLWLAGQWGWWRGASSALLIYSDTRLVDNLPGSWRVRLRRLPDVLRAVSWALLVLALARPQVGNTQEIIRGSGVDIVLALDISGSMGTEDFGSQNRLEAAKSVIKTFVEAREFDRIGLVVFAQNAFHQSPPTLDYRMLIQLLEEIQLAPDLGLDDGTAIGLGLASAANMLRDSETASKVIILLTDGAHNADGLAPVDAARRVAALGMRVYTIGIGDAASLPVASAGEVVFVENGLDEATLIEIATIAEGVYFRAMGLEDLRAVYDQINRLEQSDIERQLFVLWQDQAVGWLLSFSLLFLVSERVLRHTFLQTIP